MGNQLDPEAEALFVELTRPRLGRPVEPVPQDIADEVVEWLSSGRTLRSYCRQPGKPVPRTIEKWQKADEAFRSRVAQARIEGFDRISEETLEIVDDGTNDWVKNSDPENPGYRLNGEHVQRSRLRAEYRLKLLACWDPRRYGAKIGVGGAEDLPPVQMSAVERAAKVKSLLAAARRNGSA